ncbi:MAG: hypothetical protein AAF515_22090 [Pseudomonadota bacterium]
MNNKDTTHCLDELTISRLADDALEGAEYAAAIAQVDACPTCAARLAGARRETAALRVALEATLTPAQAPALAAQPPVPRVLLWLLGLIGAVCTVQLAWSQLLGVLTPPQWLAWLLPGDAGVDLGSVGALARTALEQNNVTEGVASFVLRGGLACFALFTLFEIARRPRTTGAAVLVAVAVLGGGLTAPQEAYAFEFRHDDSLVSVGADEVIDDTLIVFSESIVIEGRVTGDLIAFGERVTVSGDVGGMIVSAAEEVSLSGSVAGSVAAAAETVEIRNPSIMGNLYSAGESVTTAAEVAIAGNAFMAGETVTVQGKIGRDIAAAGETVNLLAGVAGDAKLAAGKAKVGGAANIGGTLTAYVDGDEERLTVDAGATLANPPVLGDLDHDEEEERGPLRQILGLLVKLVAFALSGLFLLWLVPSLRDGEISDGRDGLVTAGLGLGALIGVPIAAIIALVIVIGIPVGLITLALWMVALYVALVLAANFVGQLILDPGEDDRWVPALLLGCAILVVLTAIPFVDGIVRIVAMVLGLGLLARWVLDMWRDSRAPYEPPAI